MSKVEQQEMEKVLRELAQLTPMEYDAMRDEKAQELGVRVGTLDKEVAKRRVVNAEELADDVVEELSPWPDSVDGNALLIEIRDQITRHTILQQGCPTAVVLWSLGTFCIDAFRLFPKQHIKSPEKRCGKTILLECIESVTCRSLMTSNITAAALFRCIEAWRPTLLIDEADTFAKDNDELNGIINAGHTRRNAFVIRTVKVNDDHQPKKFCVWGAQAIAGIKDQRDTLEDRSITVSMRRKKPGEKVAKIPAGYYEGNVSLRRKCLRWANDNTPALEKSQVEVPSCGNDRAQDNWFPLFAIADLAGGQWPTWVNAAYLGIEAREADKDDSAAVMLLADIRHIFDETGRDRMHSEDLVSALVTMDDRPWAEWKRGFPMTKASLSKLLKPHKIKPKQMKIIGTNLNGYDVKSFQDAFERYLPPSTPENNSTSLHPSTGAGCSRFQDSTGDPAVEFQNGENPIEIKARREVEEKTGGNGKASVYVI